MFGKGGLWRGVQVSFRVTASTKLLLSLASCGGVFSDDDVAPRVGGGIVRDALDPVGSSGIEESLALLHKLETRRRRDVIMPAVRDGLGGMGTRLGRAGIGR